MYTQYQKCQKPSKKTYKQLWNAHINTVWTMPKYNNAKKMHYWFGNYKLKKQRNNADKSSDTETKCRQNDCACAIIQYASKVHEYHANAHSNPAKDTHQQKNTENSKKFKNKKLANRIFKIKKFDQSDSRCFSTRKNGWSYTLSDISMFTIFVRVQY